MKTFCIGGVSFQPELWRPEENLSRLLAYLDEAAAQGAQVVATPEGILDGYITRELEPLHIREIDTDTDGFAQRVADFRVRQRALAAKIKAECLPHLQQKARQHGLYLFANTLDLRDNQVSNTTFIIDPQGDIIGTYDKVHAGFEVVNELGSGYPIFHTAYAPIGVLVCADRQFPEAARAVALAGARVLIINSYGMWGEGANERFIRQRAYENGYYVLFCHPRETVLVSPEGRIIAATCGWEHVVVRPIDPAESVGRGVFGNAAMAATYGVPNVDAYEQRYGDALARRKRES